MPVTVVVGGQFGSEGKGKICAHLATTDNLDYMVRCGGPNSGHTVDFEGNQYKLRQVPAGFFNPKTRLLIAAGALVNPEVFLDEVKACGLDPKRIGIDRNAGVIEAVDLANEQSLNLSERLGSTGTGVGSAVSRRVLRDPDFKLASDHPALKSFITSVREELGTAVHKDKSIVVEGTQGFGLSLYHAEEWPFRTSRDTTAHSFLGEVGLGVRDYDVVLAIRTFPIRVAGNSGPLPNEISWEDVQRESGYPHPIAEFTTTTNKLRRVAKFDWSVVEQAVAANSPIQIALHGVDYIDYENYGVTDCSDLTDNACKFINNLEAKLRTPVAFVGTGPKIMHIVDLRSSSSPTGKAQGTHASEELSRIAAV